MLQSMRSAAKYIWWFLVVAFVGSFLLYETSGLAGRSPVTQTTAIATVNGEDILLTRWQAAVQQIENEEQQRLGHGVSLDERRTIEQQAYDQLVNEVLLRQEIERRGISVTDDEVRQAALMAPPPQALQSPDLQTDGRFDIEKYRRLLQSPMARQSGMLAGLESYYRTEIPKQKLFDQISADVFVTNERAWQIYRDGHDSAQVSFVVVRPENLTDTAVNITDAEIQTFYDKNGKRYERPGRATLSLITIPRTITSADSAAAKARAEKLRAEIVGGANFEEVAKRESADSASAVNGGALGKGGRNRFVPKFETAAYALKPGEVSQPVLTEFGYHLIRVDSHQGDTLDLRHILIPIQQSDSSATVTDRLADSVSKIAANQPDRAKFDEAAKRYRLVPATVTAIEGEPLSYAGRPVPSVSAWAFSGARPGETSELFDAPDAYYLARLDTVQKGGIPPLAVVREDIRARLKRDKLMDKLQPMAEQLAAEARNTSLEAAAAAHKLSVEKTNMFARVTLVPGLGQYTEAIGAAFTTPVGKISPAVRGSEGSTVLRVEKRVEASRAAFETQKDEQRTSLTQSLRQQRVQQYLASLREKNKISDHREKVLAQLRRQSDI